MRHLLFFLMTELKKQSETPQLWATFILYIKCKPTKESKRVRFIVNFIICDLQSLKRCGRTFLHWKGKKKNAQENFLKLARLLFLLFLCLSRASMEILASIRW